MEIDKAYLGDCIEIMGQIPDKTVDLVFADPPFNIGIKYDSYNDTQSNEGISNLTIQLPNKTGSSV